MPTTVFQRLSVIARPYRRTLFSGFGNIILNAVLDTAVLRTLFALLLFLVTSFQDQDKANEVAGKAGKLIEQMRPLLDRLTHGDGGPKLLVVLTVITGAFYILKSVTDARIGYRMNQFANQMARDIRQRVFTHLIRLSPSYLESETTGDRLSRVTGDVATLQQCMGPQLADIVRAPANIAIGLGVMVYASWKLTLLVLLLAPLIAVLVGAGGRKIRVLTVRIQERLAALNGSLVERLGNVRLIQSFVREDHESAKVARFNDDYYRDTMRSVLVAEIIAPGSELIAAMGMLVGVIVGGLGVYYHEIGADMFMLFLLQAQQVGSQFKHLSRLNQLRQQANGAGSRVFELLDTVPEIQDAPNAQPLPPVQGHIAFEQLSFSYATGDQVLQGIDFTCAPGEVIALVGESGSGKTTLVNLLPRFYEPNGGRILIDGHDLREITLASLREQTGIVPQETVLFSGTIAENIRYGKLDATDAEVEAAARAANALEFIQRLPDGFATVVGERGARLSGGQRQRVAIARALLKNPRILILDEATSALDTESEHLVQQALDRLMENRTTFVIAHRLSTVQHATRILVLDKGRIVERGTHQELLALDGIYRRLHDLQFRTAPVAVEA